jgi:hypothetical protein
MIRPAGDARGQAVVVGASMAGLFAARVLADRFAASSPRRLVGPARRCAGGAGRRTESVRILVTTYHPVARTISLVAGGVLVGWIIGQLALIQRRFFLQPVMGICRLLTVGLAARLPAVHRSS